MVAGRFKARTYRRVFRRTPGGKVTLHHVRRKPGKATCGGCGAVLKGVPQVRQYRLRNMPKTARRPERPYGGVLCSSCARRKILAGARA
jgi:large subunit ribosomal protein L34e